MNLKNFGAIVKVGEKKLGDIMAKAELIFFERTFPSANMVLIKEKKPILIDSGFGSDIAETERLIQSTGISPKEILLILNTHSHSDHVGGNHHFQTKYGTEILAHKWDADLINAGHPEACTAEWLDQPVEKYQVQAALDDHYEIRSKGVHLLALHTPGHTQSHVSYYESKTKTLISGDLLHRDDIGWINMYREGVSSLHQSLQSLDKVSQLKLKVIYPGHGPAIENPYEAIDSARTRLEKWLSHPEKVAWHACKRIFSFTLIIKDGLHKQELDSYLLGCGWFQDFARHSFHTTPQQFVTILIEEMIRSGAGKWDGDRLVASVPYHAPSKEWNPQKSKPRHWYDE